MKRSKHGPSLTSWVLLAAGATNSALSQTVSDEAIQSAPDTPKTREKHFFHFELVLSHEKVTVQSQKTDLRFPNPCETDAGQV